MLPASAVYSVTTARSLAGTGGSKPNTAPVTVMVADVARVGLASSDTDTVRLKVGLVSKSIVSALFTVIWPVAALIEKALSVLPAAIAKVSDCPASGSDATTVSTTVPSGPFSFKLNV